MLIDFAIMQTFCILLWGMWHIKLFHSCTKHGNLRILIVNWSSSAVLCINYGTSFSTYFGLFFFSSLEITKCWICYSYTCARVQSLRNI